jgi:hypothetical protein
MDPLAARRQPEGDPSVRITSRIPKAGHARAVSARQRSSSAASKICPVGHQLADDRVKNLSSTEEGQRA